MDTSMASRYRTMSGGLLKRPNPHKEPFSISISVSFYISSFTSLWLCMELCSALWDLFYFNLVTPFWKVSSPETWSLLVVSEMLCCFRLICCCLLSPLCLYGSLEMLHGSVDASWHCHLELISTENFWFWLLPHQLNCRIKNPNCISIVITTLVVHKLT